MKRSYDSLAAVLAYSDAHGGIGGDAYSSVFAALLPRPSVVTIALGRIVFPKAQFLYILYFAATSCPVQNTNY
jgi:hypothetical protein